MLFLPRGDSCFSARVVKKQSLPCGKGKSSTAMICTSVDPIQFNSIQFSDATIQVRFRPLNRIAGNQEYSLPRNLSILVI